MHCTRSPFSGGLQCCAFCTGPVNPDVIPLRGHMNRIVAASILSVVGAIVLATFGSRSLGFVAQLFSDAPALYDGGYCQLLWATFGVFVFAMSEATFLLANRLSGTLLTAVGGRITQIGGLGIALMALLSGMSGLRNMASPNFSITPEQVARDFDSNATMLAVGLCVVSLGQLVVGIGRFCDPGDSTRNVNKLSLILNRSLIVALLLLLLFLSGLFVFATSFEFGLLAKLQQSNKFELNQFANGLQGIMIYPFLAYLLSVLYCTLDGFRIVFGKLVISKSKIAG